MHDGRYQPQRVMVSVPGLGICQNCETKLSQAIAVLAGVFGERHGSEGALFVMLNLVVAHAVAGGMPLDELVHAVQVAYPATQNLSSATQHQPKGVQ